jgi:hypothetical protein
MQKRKSSESLKGREGLEKFGVAGSKYKNVSLGMDS